MGVVQYRKRVTAPRSSSSSTGDEGGGGGAFSVQ